MTRREHLLVILAEECAEVSHRVAKVLRFGLDDVAPGQTLMNAEQLSLELAHVIAMVQMLSADGAIISPRHADVMAKKQAVQEWLLHSAKQGTLTV